MSFLLHPRKLYRRWDERQARKCIVRIQHPRLKIKGKTYLNRAPAPRRYDTYVAFFGIPYAVPPVGRLRFRPPQTLLPMYLPTPRIIRAYKPYHPCLQFDDDDKLIGSEDCLYLNIYVPKKPEEIPELLPVLVYIHGGEFLHGHNAMDSIKPDNIMQNDLVLVVINYRLGPFGFLNMGTEKCPGNAGLKDQVKALEWIKDNIENFKGDPNNVTIFGHDAGATCVNLHLFSPLSKGLFHRAIMMSGGIYCPWGFKTLEELQRERRLFEKSLSAEAVGREAVVMVFRFMRPKDLMKTIRDVIKYRASLEPTQFTGFLGPSPESISKGAFIPSNKPLESLMEEATPVSTIAGIARQDGYMYFSSWTRGTWKESHYMKLVKDPACFTEFLQQNLCWSKETAEKRRDELRTMYFGDEETLQQMNFHAVQTRLATFLTDLWFHRFYDAVKIGKERRATEPLYVYQYDYLAYYDEIRRVGSVTITQDGPGHGDDIYHILEPQFIIDRNTAGIWPEETLRVIRNLCRLLANFCKNGNPISEYEQEIEWTPHSEGKPSYLSINRNLTVEQGRLKGDSWPRLRDIILSEPVAESIAEVIPEVSKKFEENFRLRMQKTWRKLK